MLLSIITFVLVLSTLILIHELGHFILAKKNGVLVQEFGIGLPPRVWGKKIGETIYSINLLPFGGFNKLLGEEEIEVSEKKVSRSLLNRAFSRKPWHIKALIISGGVIFNFILGWVIMSFLFTQGVPVPVEYAVVEEVIEESPAYYAGLLKGDKIVELTFENKVHVIDSTASLTKLTREYGGDLISLVCLREGERLSFPIIPRREPGEGEGPLGIIVSDYEIRKYSMLTAPVMGLVETARMTVLIIVGITHLFGRLILLQGPGADIAGPVGIASLTAQASKYGVFAVLQLMGVLSLNLAVVNFLPFPALDGGRFMMVMYEGLTKRRFHPGLERKLNYIGFVILIAIIVLITIKDVQSLFFK